MMPPSRYRIPKTARRAVFGHMSDYDLETQSSGFPIKFRVRELAAGPRSFLSMAMICPVP